MERLCQIANTILLLYLTSAISKTFEKYTFCVCRHRPAYLIFLVLKIVLIWGKTKKALFFNLNLPKSIFDYSFSNVSKLCT